MTTRCCQRLLAGLIAAGTFTTAMADPSLSDPQYSFGGFVKLAALYSRYSDGAVAQGPGRDFYLPSSIPVAAGPTSGKQYFDTQAKETRLFFGARARLDEHTVSGYIEGDFISGQIPQVWNSATVSGSTTTTSPVTTANKISTNAYNPALRRAYLTYDGVLLGQDWSTFQNADVLPETTDFIGGVDGLVFVRQPQARYTAGGFQAALESADTTVSGYTTAAGKNSAVALATTNDNNVPDLVLRYNMAAGSGNLSAAALLRQLRDAGTVGSLPGAATATSVGEGLSFAGRLPLWPQADLRFMLTSGRGVGRYIGLDSVGDALINSSTGELVAIPVTAGFLALHTPLCAHWTGNLILSQESANLKDSLAAAGATTQTQSVAVNAFYSPVKNLSFGTELRYGRRNALASTAASAGLIGSMDRLEFSAKYAF